MQTIFSSMWDSEMVGGVRYTVRDIIIDEVTGYQYDREKDALAKIFEGVGWNPHLVSSILLGILLWIVLYTIIIKIFGSGTNWTKFGSIIVAVIMVILTFMYVPADFIEANIAPWRRIVFGIVSMCLLLPVPKWVNLAGLILLAPAWLPGFMRHRKTKTASKLLEVK